VIAQRHRSTVLRVAQQFFGRQALAFAPHARTRQ
jgi:hypothetical protein